MAYLVLSKGWLIYSGKFLSINMLLKAVIYLSFLGASEGREKLCDYAEGEIFG